jgi:translation initiation factor IF-2
MGSMSTILLQEGTLKKGDNIVCGATYGHVRRMENERGLEINQIGPSDICVLYGLSDVPKAGDIINQVSNEKVARQISTERLLIRQEREKYQTTTNLNNLFSKIKQNEMSELRLIVKADTDGSVEAVCDSLQKLSNDEVMVNIIRKSVGGIMEADVNLASASDAIIIGFHVRANAKAKKLSEELNIEIKTYQIIFDAINDIKSAMQGMLAPEIKEKFVGQLLVKQTFKIKKVGTIAGCFVEKGSAIKTGLARVFRDDVNIHEGKIGSLKHFDQEVNEIKAGSDCGVTLKDFNDIKENDVIEIYINEEIKRDL